MVERPILFSAPMVLALLAGAKEQTRRICKGQRELSSHWDYPLDLCPYGERGDRLWVRETFQMVGGGDPGVPIYRANWREDALARGLENVPDKDPGHWKPSIFMPRAICRITLCVTDVRVERLMDISEQDAKAEGTTLVSQNQVHSDTHRTAFANLWNSINGPAAWNANPLVWVVSFSLNQGVNNE